MVADVPDLAVFDEYDAARLADGRQTMGDDDHQPLGRGGMQRAHEGVLGSRVEGRGGFVEDEDLRVAHEAAGNGQALLLTDRQGVPGTAEHGVEALRQAVHEIGAARCRERRADLVVGRIRLREADVVAHGLGEELMLLEDVGHLPAQRVEGVVAHLDAVDRHPAAGGSQERRNHVREAGLARSRGPDERHQFAGPEFQVDVAQGLAAVGVDKVDAVELDTLAQGGQLPVAVDVVLGAVVDEEEHPTQRGDGTLELHPQAAEVARGAPDRLVEPHQREEVSGGQLAGDREPRGDVAGDQADRLAEEADEEDEGDADDHGEAFAPELLRAALGELARFLARTAEALHRADVVHRLFHGVGGRRTGGAVVVVGATDDTGHRQGGEQHHREHDPGEPDQLRGDVRVGLELIHGDQVAEQHEERLEGRLVDDLRHLRGVVDHPVDLIAHPLVVHGCHGHAGQAVEQPRSQGVGDPLVHTHVHPPLDESPDGTGAAAAARDRVLGVGCRVPAAVDAGTGAAAARADQQQPDNEHAADEQHDLHGLASLEEPQDRLHVRREQRLVGIEFTTVDHVVHDDLAEPAEEQSRNPDRRRHQELGGEQSLGVTEQLDRPPDDPHRVGVADLGTRVDVVVESLAALVAGEQPPALGGDDGVVGAGTRRLAHSWPSTPTVSASTKSR